MMESAIRDRLLALARLALHARVRGERPPAVPPDLDVPSSGVFVTIHCGGDLRGCLGTLESDERLGGAVARLAADVATEDRRFPAVALAELDRVTIDLSLLTPPIDVSDPGEIEIGRHGLIVEQGRCRGLLLPQVAIEHRWDREIFLSQTSIKAGLPADAWRRGARVRRFEAEVFGDSRRTGR